MKFEIDLELPSGYELVRYDHVNHGEEYIVTYRKDGPKIKAWGDITPTVFRYLIVRKSKVLLRDIPYGQKFEFDGITYVRVFTNNIIFEAVDSFVHNGSSKYIHAVKENIQEDYKVHTFMHDTFVTKVES